MPKTVVVIPSRINSSRLPRKALLDISGFSLIQHVYLRSRLASCIDEVFVATDSTDIADQISCLGGSVIYTSTSNRTGSDRVAEASRQIDADIIINVQGDEALVDPVHIDVASRLLHDRPDCPVGILLTPFLKRNSSSDIKAVTDCLGNVIYLSRSDIPHGSSSFLKAYHVVPFRKEFLSIYTSLPSSPLEISERNEYLRVLQNGYKMCYGEVSSSSISVDTPQCLEYVRSVMPTDPVFKTYS